VTARSQRRAAEQAVIEEVRFLMNAHPSAWRDTQLADKIAALDALGLADPGRARANKGAPVTAQQAAIWMNGDKSRGVAARIVRLLTQHAWLTEEQVERMLSGKHQTISPRFTELRDNGWIVDTGYSMETSSGCQAIAWALSHAARQAINGQEGMPI